MTTKISQSNLDSALLALIGSGGGGGGIKITSIVVTDNLYTNLDDTALDTAGGYIKIIGTGFVSGCQVLISQTLATSTTFVSSTEIRAQLPATVAGTYIVYAVNTDGSVGIRINGITFSATPTWTTSSSLPSSVVSSAVSIQLVATLATTYTLTSGSTLPTGLTLSSGGLLSGSVTGIASETTYNFNITATDAELQDSPRTFSITITASDPYFNYTTLLLLGNGTNNAQNNTFLDSSANNYTITRGGTTTQGTFSPYGPNWSILFGSANYISAASNAAFGFGTGDFTVEAWVYPNAAYTTYNYIWATGATTGLVFYVLGGVLYVRTYNGSDLLASSTAPAINTWTHVAATRSGTTLRIFVNGVQTGTTTNSTNFTTGSGIVGNDGTNAAPWLGYISNLRVVKGTAVYTANFTPSTTPLTAISGTSILTCQSNRFIDTSSNAFAITVSGASTIQRFSPFSPGATYSSSTIGGSAYFNGSTDYISIPYAGDPTGNFTIEFWWYPTTFAPNYQEIFTKGINIQIFAAGGSMNAAFSVNGAAYYLNAGFGNATLKSWNHIAVVKNSTTYTGYVNGVGTVIGTSSSVPGTQSNPVSIGYYSPGPGYYTTGYISNARYVVGTAVYTTNFIPPTSPVTAVSGTQLLLNFTNAGIIDNTMLNNLETVGDAKLSTAVSKFGGSSISFDGTGDALYSTSQATIFGTGNFTIEFWIYFNTVNNGTVKFIYDMRNSSVISSSFLAQEASSAWTYWNGAGTEISTGFTSSTFSATTWTHVAICRSSGVTKFFVNGTQTNSVADTSNYANSTLVVGARYNYAYEFNGYIDDLRITKGYARYTSNFTPPVSQSQGQ